MAELRRSGSVWLSLAHHLFPKSYDFQNDSSKHIQQTVSQYHYASADGNASVYLMSHSFRPLDELVEPYGHDDVMTWTHSSYHRPFVRGVHRSWETFTDKTVSNSKLWWFLCCQSEQTLEQTIDLQVFWDAMTRVTSLWWRFSEFSWHISHHGQDKGGLGRG